MVMREDRAVWWAYGEGEAVTLFARRHDRVMVVDGVELFFCGEYEGWMWTWSEHEWGVRCAKIWMDGV